MSASSPPIKVSRFRRFALLVKNDLRHVFREPVLVAIVVVPFLMVAVLRWGLPAAGEMLPWLLENPEIILGVFSLMNATFAAFLISFVFLEERDQDLIPVLRTLPVSWSFFLFSRMGFLCLLAFIFCSFTILASGVTSIPVGKALLLALLCSATAPVYTLAVVSFANNKIEGMTWFKGLNGFLALPLLGLFFKGIWTYLLRLFPFYWTYQAFQGFENNELFYSSILIGFVMHGLFLMLLYRLFTRKIM